MLATDSSAVARLDAQRRQQTEARRREALALGHRARVVGLYRTEIARRVQMSRPHVTGVLNGTEDGSAELVARIEDIVAEAEAAYRPVAPTPPLDDGTEDDDLP